MVSGICCDCDAQKNLTKTTCTNATIMKFVSLPSTNTGKYLVNSFNTDTYNVSFFLFKEINNIQLIYTCNKTKSKTTYYAH